MIVSREEFLKMFIVKDGVTFTPNFNSIYNEKTNDYSYEITMSAEESYNIWKEKQSL